MRRWRHLRIRRGAFYGPPPNAVIPPPVPRIIRPAGALRTPARLLPSGRRTWGPAIPQGNQGQAWPQFLRLPLTPDRRGMRLLPSRRRRFDPAWPQGNQGQAWPSFTRPASTRHRLPPARRGAIRPVVPPPAAPVIAQQGTVAVSAVLAATVTISDALAGTVAISDVLAGTVTIVSDL